MTASKPSGQQLADADPQLLTAALNHTWACYDAQISRAFQIVSFYLVIAAIAGTAYTNAITNKEYGVGVALAIFGLVLTADNGRGRTPRGKRRLSRPTRARRTASRGRPPGGNRVNPRGRLGADATAAAP